MEVGRQLFQFFSQYHSLKYKKRETILRSQDTPAGVFFLKKGYVRSYSVSSDGEELTVLIYKPGDVFPYTWTLNNIPNSYYFEAMTPAELVRVPKDAFLLFLETNKEIFTELTKRLVVRFAGLLERMEHLVFGNAYEKVASILVICVERFGESRKNSVFIPLPLTHKDIAALIGLTRETVSIEIKKLEDKKIIRCKNRYIIVKSLEKLKKESLLRTNS